MEIHELVKAFILTYRKHLKLFCVRFTRNDSLATILLKLVDSYLITLKFTQRSSVNTKESFRQIALCNPYFKHCVSDSTSIVVKVVKPNGKTYDFEKLQAVRAR